MTPDYNIKIQRLNMRWMKICVVTTIIICNLYFLVIRAQKRSVQCECGALSA